MNIDIGTKIKQLRLRRGLTQEMLGSMLNVSTQAVSKWENGLTMPDIQLLPDLAVLFGVSIDALFSLSDESRMVRIENMLEDVRFLPEQEFESTEHFLKEKLQSAEHKAHATLLLAQLYAKRSNEYSELAAPLARQALLLNPDAKEAHNALFDAEGAPHSDWNMANYWELIDFYQDFVKQHPDNPRTYLWLMDLLIHDGRTKEARHYLACMDRLEHTYRTDLYEGLIARAECDLPHALRCWAHMTEEYPDYWLSWAGRADCMAQLQRYDEAVEFYGRALELQPYPKYVDMTEAMAQIAEIQGDLSLAITMRERCIELCRTDWDITDGELVDCHRREIQRLQEKRARQDGAPDA